MELADFGVDSSAQRLGMLLATSFQCVEAAESEKHEACPVIYFLRFRCNIVQKKAEQLARIMAGCFWHVPQCVSADEQKVSMMEGFSALVLTGIARGKQAEPMHFVPFVLCIKNFPSFLSHGFCLQAPQLAVSGCDRIGIRRWGSRDRALIQLLFLQLLKYSFFLRKSMTSIVEFNS